MPSEIKSESVPFGRCPRWFSESGIMRLLSGAAIKTYLALAVHCDIRWEAYPDIGVLCLHTGLCRRAVQQAITDLEQAGAISLPYGRSGGYGRATTYRLTTSANERTLAALKPTRVQTRAPLDKQTGAHAPAPLSPLTAHSRAHKGAPACAPTDQEQTKQQQGAHQRAPLLLIRKAAAAGATPSISQTRTALEVAGIGPPSAVELEAGMLAVMSDAEAADAVRRTRKTDNEHGRGIGATVINLRTLIRAKAHQAAAKPAPAPVPTLTREEEAIERQRRQHDAANRAAHVRSMAAQHRPGKGGGT